MALYSYGPIYLWPYIVMALYSYVDRQVGDPVEQADAQPADLYSYGPI